MPDRGPGFHDAARGVRSRIAHRETRDLTPARKSLIHGDPAPTPERWQVIGESLVRGDEPMDRLVTWMAAEGLSSPACSIRPNVDTCRRLVASGDFVYIKQTPPQE